MSNTCVNCGDRGKFYHLCYICTGTIWGRFRPTNYAYGTVRLNCYECLGPLTMGEKNLHAACFNIMLTKAGLPTMPLNVAQAKAPVKAPTKVYPKCGTCKIELCPGIDDVCGSLTSTCFKCRGGVKAIYRESRP